MVYPSGYHRDIIPECSSQERGRGWGGRSAKARLGYLFLVFFMVKKVAFLQMWRDGDAVNTILLMMEKGNGFHCFPKVL